MSVRIGNPLSKMGLKTKKPGEHFSFRAGCSGDRLGKRPQQVVRGHAINSASTDFVNIIFRLLSSLAPDC